MGIGQGYNLTTPLQLAFATAVLAGKGTAFRPHLVKNVLGNNNEVLREIATQPLYTLDLSPGNLQAVQNALVDVTRPGGTAALAGAGATYTFAGKTGTSQVVGIKQGEKYVESKVQDRHRDHALFITYAPVENPKIALAVLVENGGHGGAAAAPIARLVIARGMVIAANASTQFTRLIAGSITLTFATYIFVNMGMVIGILPVVGVPLPLISYGGTSMVTMLLGFGILMSIQMHPKLVKT